MQLATHPQMTTNVINVNRHSPDRGLVTKLSESNVVVVFLSFLANPSQTFVSHSPLQHQEDGAPFGSLEVSMAKHTSEFRWGHSINLEMLARCVNYLDNNIDGAS